MRGQHDRHHKPVDKLPEERLTHADMLAQARQSEFIARAFLKRGAETRKTALQESINAALKDDRAPISVELKETEASAQCVEVAIETNATEERFTAALDSLEAVKKVASCLKTPELSSDDAGFYTRDHRLRRPFCRIFECAADCKKCDGANCVVGKGITLPLQIYRTVQADGTCKRGRGLRCATDILEGTFIGCYVGVLAKQHKLESQYVFGFDKFDIDAPKRGNCMRFVNHSCEPNTRTAPVHLPTSAVPVLAFYAVRNIPQGAELTVSYGEGGAYVPRSKASAIASQGVESWDEISDEYRPCACAVCEAKPKAQRSWMSCKALQ